MQFDNLYKFILKQSKLVYYVNDAFRTACSYFKCLKNIDDNTYQLIQNNSTGFQIIIVNDYGTIILKLFYSGKRIKSSTYQISDLDNTLISRISQCIRQFLDSINRQDLIKLNISNLEIQKLLILIQK